MKQDLKRVYCEEIKDLSSVMENLTSFIRESRDKGQASDAHISALDSIFCLTKLLVEEVLEEINYDQRAEKSVDDWKKNLMDLPDVKVKEFGSREEIQEYVHGLFENKVGDDKVNNPSHYNHGEIECIDAITAALTPDELKGFVRGNVIKYLWRMEHKGGLEDLKKAQWYLDYLIKKLEGTGLDWYSPVAKKPSAGDKVLFILKGKELVSKNAIVGYFYPNLFKAYSGEYWGVEDVEMWAKAK